MIIVPGFWRFRRDNSMKQLAQSLGTLGLRTAVMDLRGHGDSGGRFGFNRFEWQDVVAVAREVASRANSEHVNVVGFSLGASIAIAAASEEPTLFSRLVLVCPLASLARIRPAIRSRLFRDHVSLSLALRPPHLDLLFPFRTRRSPSRDIARISVPVRLVHTRNDWLISHRHSEILVEAARGGRVDLRTLDIPGGFHADRILAAAPGLLESVIVEFFESASPGS